MYGFILLVGVLSALTIGERLCRRGGLVVTDFWRMAFYAGLFGLAGARLYHVFDYWAFFYAQPVRVLAVWEGGLGIWGAVAGAALGGFVAGGRSFVRYADVFAVCAPLAQAIGRWGNFFNKEVFGLPTSLPWGIYIPEALRPEGFKYYAHFHPLFLYESVLSMGLFVLLYKKYVSLHNKSDKPRDGIFVFTYLAGYSLIRLPLEFLRIAPWSFMGLPVAVWVGVICLFASVLFLRRQVI